jgi:hypothetical protein
MHGIRRFAYTGEYPIPTTEAPLQRSPQIAEEYLRNQAGITLTTSTEKIAARYSRNPAGLWTADTSRPEEKSTVSIKSCKRKRLRTLPSYLHHTGYTIRDLDIL